MRPVTPDHFVDMRSSLADARSLMRANRVGAVAVVDGNGLLVGFLHGKGVRAKL
jgi:CBS domain-containing protein